MGDMSSQDQEIPMPPNYEGGNKDFAVKRISDGRVPFEDNCDRVYKPHNGGGHVTDDDY
jgi:hypothetical protein